MKPCQRVTPILFFVVCGLVTLMLFFGACQSNEPGVTPPVIVTEEPGNITLNSATLGGKIESAQPELISMRGVVWGRNPSPELLKLTDNTRDGSGAGSFKSELTNLSLYKYYVRAYAKIQEQVFYGNEVILDINSIIPAITTVRKPSGSADALEVETTIVYTHSAPIIEKGICWSTTSNPTVNASTKVVNTSSPNTFSNTLSVSPWTPYYVRGYVITEVGIFYSNDLHVIIIPPVSLGEVTDIDGNKYPTTRIGTKVWMAENLKVTRYQDGTSIEVASSEEQFKNATAGTYTLYQGNSDNLSKFGYLYNGYTVVGSQNVCMTGWHVPSIADWSDLARSLGGLETAGGHMKAISNLWATPNTAADNASGFSALPGGSYCRVCITNGGTFADKNTDAYFWSTSGSDFYYVTNNIASLNTKGTANVNDGMSIRCVKD